MQSTSQNLNRCQSKGGTVRAFPVMAHRLWTQDTKIGGTMATSVEQTQTWKTWAPLIGAGYARVFVPVRKRFT